MRRFIFPPLYIDWVSKITGFLKMDAVDDDPLELLCPMISGGLIRIFI
ncbi:hypothetical protein [Bartonella massiliensis]|nr:hypothetical protein [Bartonella massiliensis]